MSLKIGTGKVSHNNRWDGVHRTYDCVECVHCSISPKLCNPDVISNVDEGQLDRVVTVLVRVRLHIALE